MSRVHDWGHSHSRRKLPWDSSSAEIYLFSQEKCEWRFYRDVYIFICELHLTSIQWFIGVNWSYDWEKINSLSLSIEAFDVILLVLNIIIVHPIVLTATSSTQMEQKYSEKSKTLHICLINWQGVYN